MLNTTPHFGIDMEDIIIKKNVLDDRRYKDVETIFTQEQLWSLNNKNEAPYLYHTSYLNNVPISRTFDECDVFLKTFQIHTLHSIYFKCFLRTDDIQEYDWDSLVDDEHAKDMYTTLFFVNSNDGYSLFEQNHGVKSVANQAATFPSSLKFKDSTCTNRKARIVMYMNYFK